MKLRWMPLALLDLTRFHEFLAPKSRKAAADVPRALRLVVRKLIEYPRLGERLDRFDPREVRRLLIGDYEVQYELVAEDILILRIWHTREER